MVGLACKQGAVQRNPAAREASDSYGDSNARMGLASGSAMFRISETKNRSRRVLNIDGQLAGDYVRVAEDCCSRALERGKHLAVFLRDVSAVDEAGLDLLRRLVRQGVRLHASGVYLSHLVKVIQRSAASLNQTNPAAKAQ